MPQNKPLSIVAGTRLLVGDILALTTWMPPKLNGWTTSGAFDHSANNWFEAWRSCRYGQQG